MISAIVLAAGSSARMGNINKLLLPYKNKPVVTSVVENILAGGIQDLVVVLGHEGELVKKALAGLPIQFAINASYATGMTGSIQKGVIYAKGSGYMVCLSDMVLIEPEEYAFLAKSFEEKMVADPKCICQPVYHNQNGNPVIFSSSYRQAIMSHEQPEGCKEIVQSNNEHLYRLIMKADHILCDLDYPEDYKKLLA